MPATALTVAEGGRNGLWVECTFQALDDANGNFFLNASGKVIILARNTGVPPLDLVLADVKDAHGRQLTTAEKTVTLATDEVWLAGPFKPTAWNARSGTEKGGVMLTVADATALGLAVVKLND